jgi:hypothetical protein
VNEEQAARLRAALEYVTERPREWVQDFYAVRTPCGTMACLAGRIVIQAGYERFHWRSLKRFDEDARAHLPVPQAEKAYTVVLDRPGDEYRFQSSKIANVAADLVGLDWVDADSLFAASNTLRHLWEYAAELSDGLIEVPDDLPEWADLSVVDVECAGPDAPFSHVAAYLDQVERGAR